MEVVLAGVRFPDLLKSEPFLQKYTPKILLKFCFCRNALCDSSGTFLYRKKHSNIKHLRFKESSFFPLQKPFDMLNYSKWIYAY